MSVGVIVLNKNGVSLAADSALTVGNRRAFFNSFNKLFNLGNLPVGVIIYGQVDFMSTPIDIIVEHYSNYLMSNKITYPHLKDYATNFITYLINNQDKFDFKNGEENFFSLHFKDLLDEEMGALIKKEYEIATDKELEMETIDFSGEVYNRVKAKLISNLNLYDDLTDFTISDETKKKYFELFKEKILINDSKMNELFIKDFYDIAFMSLIKKLNFKTGIAFSGYGTEDVFPAMIHLGLSALIENQVRYNIKFEYKISNDYTRWIEVLAQDDVIETYLDGISPQLRTNIVKSYKNTYLEVLKSQDLDFLNHSQMSILVEKIEEAADNFKKVLLRESKKNWEPIYDSIESAPVLDLISFSENLINLTSLKRKYTLDDDNLTVGGPIDVAYITKFDGFNWHKRKTKSSSEV